MAYIIKMPKLGLEMERGTVLEWYVETGDEVTKGDVVVEVESEKSIGEVEAREDGALREQYLEEGGTVPPGTPIGILAAPDADISDLKEEVEAELAAEEPEEVEAEAGGAEASQEAAVAETGGAGAGTGGGAGTAQAEGSDSKVSPRARKRAEELGVDIATVDGTGFEGAVTEEDVEAAESAGPPEVETETGFQWVEAEERAMERYQREAAVMDPAAAETLFETMESVRAAFEQRVTMTDVLIVITSEALEDEPVLNGTFTESTHQVQETQNIALVAEIRGDSIRGVISDAANQSLTDIVDERQLIDAGTEMATSGATFTLANAAETEQNGRLVNPPAVAALEVDATSQRAVPTENGVDLQPLVTASLTYDTRALGGGEVDAFLDQFNKHARNASELLLGSYRGTE